ncbi:MAG: PilZ domain-containing protein [Aestuariibacter sp.]
MDKVLEQYSDVVEKLKPFVNKPNFSQMVNKFGAGVPKQKIFLIKMELKRLAQPTHRPVDLRGKVDGECKPFEYQGVTHFLDEAAKQEFAQQTMAYGGYTVGVWEAVNNSENTYRVKYQKEKEALLQSKEKESRSLEAEVKQKKPEHLIAGTLFSRVISRKEERMNYAISIEVVGEDDRKIKGTTIDISVSGMRAKFEADEEFIKNQQYGIFLRGLEQEYALDRKNPVIYECMRIEVEGFEQRVNFKRVIDNSPQEVHAFLQRFIHGYKRRYKINMENTEEAVVGKIYEQYYTPNIEATPVFLGISKGKLMPKFLLTNNLNKEFVKYWTDETDNVRIESLLNASRIKRAMQKETSEFYVFCFKQVKNDKVFFCSATLDELNKYPSLRGSYLALGAKRDSWRVYKVQLSDINAEQAHIPLTIPESVSEKVKKLNMPPAPRVMADLRTLKFIALITDITSEDGTQLYQNFPVEKADVAKISKLIHPRSHLPSALTVHPYKYIDNRIEQRFFLSEKAKIEWNDGFYDGKVVDFSYSGMMIRLDEEIEARKGALIKVTLPNLQKMTSQYNLDRLSYKLVGLTEHGTQLHMKALENKDKEQKPHHGKLFFTDLIRQNREKLETKITEDTSNYSTALRNIFSANIFNMALFWAKDGIHLKHDTMVCGDVPNTLWPLFTHGELERNEFNLLPLFGQDNIRANWLTRAMRELKGDSPKMSHELFIAFNPEIDGAEAFDVEPDVHLKSAKSRIDFIKSAQEKAQFFAVKLFFVKVGKPDPESLSAELNYIKVYAPHKAQSIQNHIWEIMSFVDIVDITDEVLLRYGLNKPASEQ